jgi:hypothetical protein
MHATMGALGYRLSLVSNGLCMGCTNDDAFCPLLVVVSYPNGSKGVLVCSIILEAVLLLVEAAAVLETEEAVAVKVEDGSEKVRR